VLSDYTVDMPAHSAPGSEDRRGPIAGLPSGVDYECIKSFSLELPPAMVTLVSMARADGPRCGVARLRRKDF